MVGLVVDTGILLIEYGKLKRGVDAAAVASAQQYRLSGSVLDKTKLENAARNFLQLNQKRSSSPGSSADPCRTEDGPSQCRRRDARVVISLFFLDPILAQWTASVK